MYTLRINDDEYNSEKDVEVLDFLRENLRLTSVKNGCGDGPCGACMVLIDGKASRACLYTAAKVDGKKIVTVEGLPQREQEVFAHTFAKSGAVQCGFCIPGMVISASGLLATNPDPTLAEVKKAIQPNICRCTGYRKIEEAILDAARMLRENEPIPEPEAIGEAVGSRVPRTDAQPKVLGTAEYVDDLQVPGMLHGAALRAPAPRVLLKGIDTREAAAMPGVVAIMTAKDIPGERYQGHIIADWPAMIDIGEETRYVGDAIAIVAATTRAEAKAAAAAIKLDYEVLKPLSTPQEALAEGAPKIHPEGNLFSQTSLGRGDVDAALKTAAHVAHFTFHTPQTEHAYLEPESALAVPQPDGSLTVYTGTQSLYDDHHAIIGVLGLPADKVRIIGKNVGGGFGGKEDLSVQHHAALLAWHTGQPVKMTMDRIESIRSSTKRHAMEMDYTVACDESGVLTAVKARILANKGAYASLGSHVLRRACTHAGGPYKIPNVTIEGLSVYTNDCPGGAFRGFGVTQTCFAMESCLNYLAAKVGISPWEIRYRNAVEPGDTLPNDQLCDESTDIKETLLAVKDAYDSRPDAGISCALKSTGLGGGCCDVGRVRIRILGGKPIVYTSAACIGQGLGTTVLQMASDASGLPFGSFEIADPDTDTSPDGGTTTASRQTWFTGEAARVAGQILAKDLETQTLEQLEGREYYGEYAFEGDQPGEEELAQANHVAYGYATHVVLLDEAGKIEKIVAAHDVGRAINPTNVEGQIEGGVLMGMGFALTENFPYQESDPTAKFGTLGLFRANNTPRIEGILVEGRSATGTHGGKGVGEIVSIPTAPAISGAYYRRDGLFRTELPLRDTPYSRKK